MVAYVLLDFLINNLVFRFKQKFSFVDVVVSLQIMQKKKTNICSRKPQCYIKPTVLKERKKKCVKCIHNVVLRIKIIVTLCMCGDFPFIYFQVFFFFKLPVYRLKCKHAYQNVLVQFQTTTLSIFNPSDL